MIQYFKNIKIYLLVFTISLPVLAMENPHDLNGDAIDTIEVASMLLQEYIKENPIDFPTATTERILHPISMFFNDEFNYKKIFNEHDAAKIEDILFQYQQDSAGYDRPFIHADGVLQKNKKVTLAEGGARSKLANLDSTDKVVIKVTCQLPGRGSPFASPLRVFNGQRMEKLIRNNNWDMLYVPKEGLVPLITEDKFLHLDESVAPYAFLIASEKVVINNSTEELLSLNPQKQIRAALQLCLLLVATNLGDASWGSNIICINGKIFLIDNEPLFGSVVVSPPNEITNAAREYVQQLPWAKDSELSDQNCIAIFIENKFCYYKKMANTTISPLMGLSFLYNSALEKRVFVVAAVAEMFCHHYRQ